MARALNCDGPVPRSEGVLGSGLSLRAFLLILAGSTTFFLLWDGALWSAHESQNHVQRILFSYLLIVPLVAAYLTFRKKLHAQQLFGSIGLLWATKLLLTVPLYLTLSPGTANQYEPSRPWENAAQPKAPDQPTKGYRTAESSSFEQGTIVGRVALTDNEPALVYLSQLAGPGKPAAPKSEQEIAIEGGRYQQVLFAVQRGTRLHATNKDDSAHTLIISRGDRRVGSKPIPPHAGADLTLPAADTYQLRCALHESEVATLVALDHPYFTWTSDDGTFRLESVPAGQTSVSVQTATRKLRPQSVNVTNQGETRLQFQITAALSDSLDSAERRWAQK